MTLQDCVSTWKETLASLGVRRNINYQEECQIKSAVLKWGAEFCELALYGYRFRKEGKDFNPRDYISLRHVFGKDLHGHDRIDMYANLGAPKRESEKRDTVRAHAKQAEDNVERTDPARVREIIASAFKGIK